MIYAVAKTIFRALFRFLFRVRVTGAENLPSEGPVVLCSNHISWWDPPNVGCAVTRKVHFMAKEELFQIPILGFLITRMGAFPVRRGTADRTAIRRALEVLRQGGVLGLFPEGTRSRTGRLRPAEPGAALIAIRSGAPVLPVAIEGPYRPFRPVAVRIGPPLSLAAHDGGRITQATLARASREIMAGIAALLPDGQVMTGEVEGLS